MKNSNTIKAWVPSEKFKKEWAELEKLFLKAVKEKRITYLPNEK